MVKSHFASTFLRTWLVLGGLRIAAFAILLILDATQRMPLSAVLLTLPLYPEGLLVPQGVAWTVWTGSLFIVALLAGSAVMAAVITIVGQVLCRR
jgi:hypothetical protein